MSCANVLAQDHDRNLSSLPKDQPRRQDHAILSLSVVQHSIDLLPHSGLDRELCPRAGFKPMTRRTPFTITMHQGIPPGKGQPCLRVAHHPHHHQRRYRMRRLYRILSKALSSRRKRSRARRLPTLPRTTNSVIRQRPGRKRTNGSRGQKRNAERRMKTL